MNTIDTTVTGTQKALRDLSDEEFRAEYACDRFTATVLGNRFRYIVKHMSTALLTQAFSQIIRDWYDFAAVLSGPPEQNYSVPAVGDSIPLFLGTMSDAVRNTVVEFGPENLKPGDVLVCNDPYRIGTHVNDTLFVRPVFHEGKIITFFAFMAHMIDMGGIVPAGFSGTKKNVYENGLVIPPVKLYEDDRLVRSTISFILDNVRMGAIQLPDIQTIHQSMRLAERLFLETLDRYGAEAALGAMRYCCDASADTMQRALESVPDGVYEGEDIIDADGIDESEDYTVRVKVIKCGGNVEVDLSGSSRQARTSINAGFLDAKTTVGVALRYLIDRDSAYTSGSYRHIDVVVPPGTVVSAMPPDGAIFLYWESIMPVLTSIFGALSDALGDGAVAGDFGGLSIHNANGLHPDGTPWVSMAQAGGEKGPWGGTKDGDADSFNTNYVSNNIEPATEQIESDVPMIVLRKEYAPDTAGPGANRGGAAVVKDTMWPTEGEHYSMPLHFKKPTGIGVNGGGAGKLGATWVFSPEAFNLRAEGRLIPLDESVYRDSEAVAGILDPDTKAPDAENGEYFYFARVPIWRTRPDTIFRYLTNGGGGWGDPLTREVERVMRDVRDGYSTITGAAAQYGVVIEGDPDRDPEGLTIDHEATRALRADLEARR
jgi:N-methylhydantoinase B